MTEHGIAGSVKQLELGVRQDTRRRTERHGRKANTDHCKCGQCRSCAESSRWEQIYKERFMDPEYYRRKTTIRVSSPLGDL